MISTTGEIPIGLYRTNCQDKNEYASVKILKYLFSYNFKDFRFTFFKIDLKE